MKTLFEKKELEPLGINLETESDIRVYIPPLDVYLDPTKGESNIILPNIENMLEFGIDKRVSSQDSNEEEIDLLEDDVIEEEEEEEEVEEIDIDVEEEEEEVEEIDVDEVNDSVKEKDSSSTLPPTPPEGKTGHKPPPTPPIKIEPSWSDDFFDDDYLLSLPIPSRKMTEIEVDFLINNLDLNGDPKSVLDIGCGDGRHAIAIADKGHKVTAIEQSVPFLLLSSRASQELGIPVSFVKKDAREFTPPEQFDVAYSIGGSFGYYSDSSNIDYLTKLYSFVKPGGKVILEAINHEFAVSTLPSRMWWEGNGCMIMDESYFLFNESRISIKRNAAYVSGKQKNYNIKIRAYSYLELSLILEKIGFKVEKIVGSFITPDDFLGKLSPSLLMVLTRV